MKHGLLLLAVLLTALLLAGCAAQANALEDMPNEEGEVAGFWLGLWHGIIAPITFVVSLFNRNVGIYEVYNNGGWYNLGFLLGLGAVWGGGGAGAGRSSR